jgi:Glutamine cyclotransferase
VRSNAAGSYFDALAGRFPRGFPLFNLSPIAISAHPYRNRKIYQIDPDRSDSRTIESNRFVTGVSWVNGELWHGTWEDDQSDLRRFDPRTGEVLESLDMPFGVAVFSDTSSVI